MAFVACASFDADTDPPAVRHESSSTAVPGNGATPSSDASASDAGSAASADAQARTAQPLVCGDTTCSGATGCCVSPQGATCSTACASLYFQCLGAANCGPGEVCCANDKTASCAKSCTTTVVCLDSNECGAGEQCVPQSCGGKFSYSICAGASRPEGVDCAL